MIHISLQGRSEKLTPLSLYHPNDYKVPPLYHQTRTREALRDFDVVMNTYNTGTGKTRAAFGRLLDLRGQGVNVLFIAPTNELISQHMRDASAFVTAHNLDYKVMRVTAADIRGLTDELRVGEILQRLITNYLEFDETAVRRQPLLMVTNPDIFYYALYFRYSAHDRFNVFEKFLTKFDYIIIDEFHYYNAKQIANFLFAMILFDQYGYFAKKQRRLCLLSATPRPGIIDYLSRVFGARFALIAPDNEPPESAAYPSQPALAPLSLTLQAGRLIGGDNGWLPAAGSMLRGWLRDEHLDGAIISDSLGRINDSFASLHAMFSDDVMGRITGPQDSQARHEDAAKPLILATPTVDIGYNFDKQNKPQRQNIDFLVCEARYVDDLKQRIGRAGRVLSKQHHDIPSRAVALVHQDVINALQDLNGQTLTREVFFERLDMLTDSLPTKHTRMSYLNTYAVQEAAYPLSKLSANTLASEQGALDRLFDQVQRVMAPNRTSSFQGLINRFRTHEKRKRWLEDVRKSDRLPDRSETIFQFRDWAKWQGRAVTGTDRQYEDNLDKLWRAYNQSIIQFVQSQVTLQDALFRFRDSFQGPTAVLYDDNELFSRSRCTTYDLFHLITHYDLEIHKDRTAFLRAHSLMTKDTPDGEFYVTVKRHRDEKLKIELTLNTPLSQDQFAEQWTNRPIAFYGLTPRVRDKSGATATGVLPLALAEVWVNQPIVGFVPSSDMKARAAYRLDDIIPLPLKVLADGGRSAEYIFYGGLAAFEVDAALRSVIAYRDRMGNKPIIIWDGDSL